jgi:hypothetical protein
MRRFQLPFSSFACLMCLFYIEGSVGVIQKRPFVAEVHIRIEGGGFLSKYDNSRIYGEKSRNYH